MRYRAVILEGKTDEAFLLEVLKQKHNGVQCRKNGEDPGFGCRTIVKLEGFDGFKIATVISGGETELVNRAYPLIKGSIDGLIPNLERIAICRDLDKSNNEEIVHSIVSQLQARASGFGHSLISTSFGCEVSGFPVHIIPVGDSDFIHQCKDWGHCVEDYLIEVIQDSENEITRKTYNGVCCDAIQKGISLDLNTCAKSPLYVTIAFTQPRGNLEGFYRKLVGENFPKMNEILERTSFTRQFDEFLS